MAIFDTRALFFPYCLQQLEDKTWVVLNRNYKPLGSPEIAPVVYEEVIPPKARIQKITKIQMEALSSQKPQEYPDTIYLYTEGCDPTRGSTHMAAYMKRLEILFKLKLVKEEE